MTLHDPVRIAAVVNGLDRWFESMRVSWPTPGYGGPVVHWWNHCLAYRGTGLDWRYEGIIAGYLALWRSTSGRVWLERAIRAGDDLLGGQRPDGHYANSQFEQNPGIGGTPHEAAADLGLLLLARELRVLGNPTADRYLAVARRNLESYWFDQLWDSSTHTLWDARGTPSFVPNKAATFMEAVLLLAELTGNSDIVERYALPTGERILGMQERAAGALTDGAIAQNRLGDRLVQSYFPLYIARCVPGLLALAVKTDEHRFREGAVAAAIFVERVRLPDGGLPQVLYPGQRRNRQPRWVAGAGDVVRALRIAAEHGAPVDPQPTIEWIMRGARRDGHVVTADGFRKVIPLLSRRDRFADDLGVVGWADKAFRALVPYADASMVQPAPLPSAPESTHSDLIYRVLR